MRPPIAKKWATPPEHEASEEKLTRLQSGPKPGTSKVPFPVIDRDSFTKEVHEQGSVAKKTHGAPIALVNLRDLQTIQHTVNDERLVQHLDNPGMIPPGTKGSGHGGLVDRPIVVRKGGRLVVWDGNHRLTAAHLRGQDTAKVRLVDLDGDHQNQDLGEDRAT